jgi:zinc transport system substrate-binding protein
VGLLHASISYAKEQITVYTVNYPLAYFAERIGGDFAHIEFPAPPEIDPAFWTPNNETITQFQKADLIILNGAKYAKWVNKVSLPMLRTIDTSKSFKDEFIAIENTVTHSHGPSGDHSHSGTAFTTWLDFSFAARQAEAIYQAFIMKIPDRESELKSNYEALKTDLLLLDEQMMTLSSTNPDKPLVASHPIYQYMARRYHLNLSMVMWEPDAYPDEKEWQNLDDYLKKHRAKWMIWESGPLSESIQKLETMGLNSLVFSPCFNRPPQGDFLTVMMNNIENFENAFNQSN